MARKTAEEAGRTRESLVQSARVLFAERGYAATSADEIAHHAGISKGGLYHHFVDKRDLFLAAFQQIVEELDQSVLEAVTGITDTWEFFETGCRSALEAMSNPEYIRIAIQEAPAVIGVDEWHRIDTAAGLQTMEAGLQLLEADGIIERTSPALAILLFGALTQAGLALGRGERGVDRDDLLSEFVRLVRSLGPRS